MKVVTREEYVRKVNADPDLSDVITEGHKVCAVQWTKEGRVVAQAFYERLVEGEPVSRTYYINDEL
jgi:hypothetical protein